MVKNNHSESNRIRLDELFRAESRKSDCITMAGVMDYAHLIASIENVIVVVSDLTARISHIIKGSFASRLDLGDYSQENSIWENRILSLMSPEEQEMKYLAELRFFNYLRRLPKSRKPDYYLMSKLRFRFADGEIHDVLHRLYYIFDGKNESVRYAVCTYGPLPFDLPGKSYAVDSITGVTEDLTAADSDMILSKRERQVLSLIDTGMKSAEIARQLNISIHTVCRHRQEIIIKLQVKNTHEACRVAKNLRII